MHESFGQSAIGEGQRPRERFYETSTHFIFWLNGRQKSPILFLSPTWSFYVSSKSGDATHKRRLDDCNSRNAIPTGSNPIPNCNKKLY